MVDQNRVERREAQAGAPPIELRADGTAFGVAMVYGQSAEVEGLRETFAGGALAPADGAAVNYRHTAEVVDGSPVYQSDETRMGVVFTPTQAVAAEIREGKLGMSVEFVALRELRDRSEGVRQIDKALLTGVALTPNPAYPGTSVEMRHGSEKETSTPDIADWLL